MLEPNTWATAQKSLAVSKHAYIAFSMLSRINAVDSVRPGQNVYLT